MEEEIKNNQTEEMSVVGTQANENKDEEKKEKTYTQAEYNAFEKKIKEKYEKKYDGIDIARYKAWEESQKTEAEKQAEKEAEYQKNLAEGQKAIRENKVLKADVAKEYVNFVAFTVSEQEGDFDENLAKFLKENPKYLQNTETQVIKRTSSSVSMSGKTQPNVNETNKEMNDLIRSARGN